MKKTGITVFICGDWAFDWGAQLAEEQQRERDLEEDLAIELALNPFEEIDPADTEQVPLHVALSWRD